MLLFMVSARRFRVRWARFHEGCQRFRRIDILQDMIGGHGHAYNLCGVARD